MNPLGEVIRDRLDTIRKSLDLKGWVKCPSCDREVTRLRPCFFDFDGKSYDRRICVDCAENPFGLFYVQQEFPIDGIALIEYGSGTNFEKQVVAYVEEKRIRVWRKGCRLALALKEGDYSEPGPDYDHVYRAWAALRERANAPALSVSGSGWNARSGKKDRRGHKEAGGPVFDLG